MKKFWILVCCALLAFSTACDGEATDGEEGDETEETEETEEEGDEEGDESTEGELDLESMIAEQQENINEAACDRPFECMEDSEDYGPPEGYAAEDCYERHGFPEGGQDFLETQDPSDVETCLGAGEAVTDCLMDVSCEQNVAWSHPRVDTGVNAQEEGVCAEEMQQQMSDCDFFIEWQREQMAGEQPGGEQPAEEGEEGGEEEAE